MSGESDKAKGRVEKATGDLTDDPDKKREGQLDEKAGKAKDTLDDLKKKAENAVDSVKDKLSGD